MVLPWLPATATPYLRRISSASISARGITGMPQRAAPPRTSGLSRAHRGGGHHHVGAGHVARRGGPRRCARPAPARRSVTARALQVGARDRVAQVQQHLGDAAHADAADADEVHVLDLPKHVAPPPPSEQVGDAGGGVGPPRRRARRRPWPRARAGVSSERRAIARGQATRPSGPSPRPSAPRPPPPARGRSLRWWSSAAPGERARAPPPCPPPPARRRWWRRCAQSTRSACGEARLHVVEEGHHLGLAAGGRVGRRHLVPHAPRPSGGRCAARRARAGAAAPPTSARFSTREPWLPPKASSVQRRPVRLARAAPAKPPRTGLPVSTPLRPNARARLLVGAGGAARRTAAARGS